MITRNRIVVAGVLVCMAYAAWPYVTLFRLAQAARHGDVATLQALIDWDELREGIEEDICDAVFDTADTKAAPGATELPPFGYSFARGIAAGEIEAEVNAEALVSALHPGGPAGAAGPGMAPAVVWAFYESPTRFSVLLKRPGAAKHEAPIRLRLELRRDAWTVTRVWLPPRMLMQASAGN